MGARFYEQLKERPEAQKQTEAIQQVGFPALMMPYQRLQQKIAATNSSLRITTPGSSPSSVRRRNRGM